MRPFVVKALSPHIQGSLIAFSYCFQLTADVLMHPFMPAVVLRMTGSAPFQINSQQPPTKPTSGSSQALPADWQRASRYHCGSLRASRDAQRSAQNFCAPFRCAHLPPHAPPRDNGYTHRAPLKAHSACSGLSPPALKIHRPYFVEGLCLSPTAQTTRLGERGAAAAFASGPLVSSTRLNVLSLATSPCRRKYNSRILRGPQARCASFKRTISHTSSSASCLEWLCGRRDSSSIPPKPLRQKRSLHL